MKIIDADRLRGCIINKLCGGLQCDDCSFIDDGMCAVAQFIEEAPPVEIIAEPPKRSDGIISEHSNGMVSMTKQTWEDMKETIERYRNEIEDWTIKRWEHDGCDGCEYELQKENDEPCLSCKQNYEDKWTRKKKKETLVDKKELLDKLFTLADDAQTEDEKNGLFQAIAVTLMSERANNETDGI